MKKRLLIVALVAGMLSTLFSCTRYEKVNKFVEENTSIRQIKGCVIHSFNSSNGIAINIVITNTDTITIWSKYLYGSVIIDKKPIKR